jgi:predicted nucleic acid-binding protein
MELIDTDVLIDIQRGHPPALTWFAALTDLPAVPGFVVMELIQDARNAREVRKALKLAAPFPIVWPTDTDCARALTDFTVYHLSHSLGLLDAMIGACAVGRSATLYTFNVKHYRPIPGLVIVKPYIR